MKGTTLTVCLLFALMICSGSGWAGQEILDSLIQLALKNNPDLQAAINRQSSSEFSARSAGSLPDPRISIGALNLPKSSLALDETPMSGLSIGLSQMIPWPGELRGRAQAARSKNDIALKNVQATKNTLIRDIKTTYYDYSYWVLAKKIIEENQSLTDAIVQVAETRYSHGDISARDLLRVKTLYTRLDIRLRNAGQQIHSAKLAIGRLLGENIAIGDLPPELPENAESGWVGKDILNNPVLASANLNADVARANLSVARAQYWPDLTLGVDYRIRDNVPGDPVRGEDWLSFKLSFNIPLWFFARQKNDNRAAYKSLESHKDNARSTRDRLVQQVADNQQAIETIRDNLASYNSSILPQARATLEAARVAYEVGQIDFDAFLNSQFDLLEIELERLQLINQLNQRQAKLAELYGVNYEK